MTDLVTDAAIDAALKARWQTGMEWLRGKDETPDTALRNQLEAAAPFIAAEALRQAANEEFLAGPEPWNEAFRRKLRARADELERDDD